MKSELTMDMHKVRRNPNNLKTVTDSSQPLMSNRYSECRFSSVKEQYSGRSDAVSRGSYRWAAGTPGRLWITFTASLHRFHRGFNYCGLFSFFLHFMS